MGIAIQEMTPQDIPFGLRLCRCAGWNQTAAGWRRFLALSPEGCFVAQWNGRDAGTVVATVFGGKVGWIAMTFKKGLFLQENGLVYTGITYRTMLPLADMAPGPPADD